MNVKTYYICPMCEAEHEGYTAAKYCCSPVIREVSVCGVCGKRYEDERPEVAEDCCKALVAKAEREAELRRCLCGQAVTEADVTDSRILGSLIRCRPCILRVAPEMQTAEQIAYGRAA